MTVNSPTKAVWLLLAVCAIWGLMFVLVDQTIEHLPVHSFHTFRFGVAALCLWPLWRLDREAQAQRFSGREMRKLLLTSAGLALIMFVSFASQTLGMQYTSVSNTGFITGLCVPLVPILGLLMFRVRVKPVAWVEFYGPSRTALQTRIQEINQKLSQEGFQGVLYRAVKGREAQDDLENAQLSMENLEMRAGEMRQKLRSTSTTSRENLELRHDLQRENLEMSINNPSAKAPAKDKTPDIIRVDNPFGPDAGLSKGRSR